MTRSTRRQALVAFAASSAALLGASSIVLANAENIYGKFSGFNFNSNVMSLTDVTGGTIRGSRDVYIKPNTTVLIFTNGLAKGFKSPDAFNQVSPGTEVEITMDTQGVVASVQVGVKSKSKSKKKKGT